MLSRHNTQVLDWGINTDDYEYHALKELEEGKSYPLRGCFVSKDHGYGEGAVLITDGFFVNIPQRYVSTIEEIRKNEDDITQIMEGRAAFRFRTFVSTKYKREGYAVDFLDVEPEENPFT